MLGNIMCRVLKATTSPAMTDIVMDCKQDIGKGSVRIIVVRSMHFSQTAYLSCFSMGPTWCLFRLLLSDSSCENGRRTAF